MGDATGTSAQALFYTAEDSRKHLVLLKSLGPSGRWFQRYHWSAGTGCRADQKDSPAALAG